MPLTTAEVEHIAELARLSLTEQEKTLFQDQLSAILDYAAVLQGRGHVRRAAYGNRVASAQHHAGRCRRAVAAH